MDYTASLTDKFNKILKGLRESAPKEDNSAFEDHPLYDWEKPFIGTFIGQGKGIVHESVLINTWIVKEHPSNKVYAIPILKLIPQGNIENFDLSPGYLYCFTLKDSDYHIMRKRII